MKKYFSETVDRYFRRWISIDAWHTHHPFDMERFYAFIKALKRYSRKPWLNNLHEKIIIAFKHEHPDFDETYLDDMASYFHSLAHKIFDYESTPFPDPLVEMKNPYSVELRLQSMQRFDKSGKPRPLYTEKQIEKILVEKFGPDWKGWTRRRFFKSE